MCTGKRLRGRRKHTWGGETWTSQPRVSKGLEGRMAGVREGERECRHRALSTRMRAETAP